MPDESDRKWRLGSGLEDEPRVAGGLLLAKRSEA
jgi:hypothetical protein